MLDPGDLPMCAVCGVRVARVEVVFSPAADLGLGAHSVVAHCHGQTEVVDLTGADLLAMVPGSIRAGVAFARELDTRDTAFRQPRPYAPIRGGRDRRDD